MGLTLGSIRRGDGIDNGLCLLVTDLLVVVDNIADVVATCVVSLAHAHRVVCQVDIAIVAKDWWRGKKEVSFTDRVDELEEVRKRFSLHLGILTAVGRIQ